jgi:hypothetical protein
VEGIADYPDNQRRGFAITGQEPIYNFVVDIEFFRQLPLASGRVFTATLYDPPNGSPARYTFTVAGSDSVTGPDGKLVDCWVLTSDYNRPGKPLSRYWLAKRTQYLIRQESPLDDGSLLVKALLPAESAD